MSHIGSIRRNGNTSPGETIQFTTQTVVITEAFEAGYSIFISPTGSGVIEGSLSVNYQEKLLIRGDDYDYTLFAVNIILNFADDPTQYANGEIILQISYAYNA